MGITENHVLTVDGSGTLEALIQAIKKSKQHDVIFIPHGEEIKREEGKLYIVGYEAIGYTLEDYQGNVCATLVSPHSTKKCVSVSETVPTSPNVNDLWLWDGNIKRYNGANWVDEIATKDNALKIECDGYDAIPEYMYHIEHEDDTYIIKFDYKYEDKFYTSSSNSFYIRIKTFNADKPLKIKVYLERINDGTWASSGDIVVDGEWNEIIKESNKITKGECILDTSKSNAIFFSGYGDTEYDSDFHGFADFRGYIKIWQE